MRILDAYLLRRIVKPLILVFTAFIGIFILVDLFDHAHTFIDNRVPIGIVLSYYAYYLPLIVVLTMPVAMLLTTLLSIGGLARKHEIMAMKGSGLSLYRMLAPLLLLSLVLSFASMAVAETLLPPATTRRLQIEEEHLRRRADQIHRRNVLYVCPDGAVFLARRFNTKRLMLEDVTIEEFDDQLRPVRRIDAESGRWIDDRWVLERGHIRTFSGTDEEAHPFDTYDLERTEPAPSDLRSRKLEPDEMGHRQLKAYIARLTASGSDPGDLAVQLQLKIAFPFVTLIMTMIGAPLAAGARRTGFALSFTAALAISFLFYGLLQVGQVLGRQGMLPPTLAAWIGNIVFAGIGVWLIVKAPK